MGASNNSMLFERAEDLWQSIVKTPQYTNGQDPAGQGAPFLRRDVL